VDRGEKQFFDLAFSCYEVKKREVVTEMLLFNIFKFIHHTVARSPQAETLDESQTEKTLGPSWKNAYLGKCFQASSIENFIWHSQIFPLSSSFMDRAYAHTYLHVCRLSAYIYMWVHF
jgi:hypothetical protein